jgi:hypothetical protein
MLDWTRSIVRDVTGWQGNEGGYGGGWDPQQNPQQHPQQNPYGNQQYGGQPQYGADPYGGQQYGADPYAQPQYGADPYNPYGQGTTAQYQGFGPPQPPKGRPKWPIIASIVAIVAIVGAVVTIVLLNKDDDQPTAANTGTSSSAKPAPNTKSSAPPSSRRPTPSASNKPAPSGDPITITGAGIEYAVPGGWKKDTTTRDSGLGVNFTGGAVFGDYNCGGSTYFRGFTASADIQGKDGAQIDLNKTVTDFAVSFAKKYYPNPSIDGNTPKSKTVDGKKAATLSKYLAIQPTKPDCEARAGEVAVVGILLEEPGKPVGVRMVVVVNDLNGGPADPKPPADEVAEEILDTVKLK